MPIIKSGELSAHADSRGEFRTIPASNLPAGTRLNSPIFDERDVLLLADGQVLTPAFLTQLANRKIGGVRVRKAEAVRLMAAIPRGAARTARADRTGFPLADHDPAGLPDVDSLPVAGGPAFNERVPKRTRQWSETDFEACVDAREAAIQELQRIQESLAAGRKVYEEQVDGVAVSILNSLEQDTDLFTAIAGAPDSSGYPTRHSWHASAIAVQIGVTLGLSEEALTTLAAGVLLHDACLEKVAGDVCARPKVLSELDFLPITKHPAAAVDVAHTILGLQPTAALIAYQMHERCDGSGYPRGIEGQRIHGLSKIAAVADCYAALVTERPHRPAMLPYSAVDWLVRSAAQGTYDSHAVRGLLKAVSLFPVGSFVELTDGRAARVLRSGGEQYSRPVVEAVGDILLPDEVIDLREREEDFGVSKPLAELPEGPFPFGRRKDG